MPRDPESSSPPPTVPTELRAAPPTAPTGKVHERRKVWHKVLGLISVIFGGFGLFGLPIQSLAYLFDWFEIRSDHDSQGLIRMIFTTVVSFGLSVLILSAGICLLKRNPKAAVLYHFWSISYGLALLVFSGFFFSTILGEMQNPAAGSGTAGVLPAIAFVIAGVMTFLQLFFGAIPITFLVIWFRRTAVREEIARWSQDRSLGDPA